MPLTKPFSFFFGHVFSAVHYLIMQGRQVHDCLKSKTLKSLQEQSTFTGKNILANSRFLWYHMNFIYEWYKDSFLGSQLNSKTG